MANHYTVKKMFALQNSTQKFLESLPAEFSKSEYDKMRKNMETTPLALDTCRILKFVKVVRTEPCTYSKRVAIWTDPVTGKEYDREEMERFWSKELAAHFDVLPGYSIYRLPYEYKSREYAGFRNIFSVDMEQFRKFCEEAV